MSSMKTREDIIESLRTHKAEIEARFTARRIGLFGSFAHSAAESGSDVDIGAKVELVLADTIKPRLKPYIDRDLIYA
jgi:hypothetical protein